MAAWSPTLEGFRAMFRRPAVPAAEIMWRWSFGAGAFFLLAFGFLLYLDTLPVSNVDRLLLRTGHPLLVSHALSHILEGSALRFVMATIVLFSALAVFWVLLCALGRGATLQSLLDYVRGRSHAFSTESAPPADAAGPSSESCCSWRLRSLIGLNFLRASLALAAGASILAALILAGFASSKAAPHPGTVFLLSCVFVMLTWLIWSSVNWFLSVASVFVVREGADTFGCFLPPRTGKPRSPGHRPERSRVAYPGVFRPGRHPVRWPPRRLPCHSGSSACARDAFTRSACSARRRYSATRAQPSVSAGHGRPG